MNPALLLGGKEIKSLETNVVKEKLNLELLKANVDEAIL